MISEIKLLPCPFCGGKARIQLTDEEGNWRERSYLQNPYSGIGYVLIHTNNAEDECPIATYSEDETSLGIWNYDSEKSAVEAWNRRAGEQNGKDL